MKHEVAIKSLVGRMRPACETITEKQDETEDWWWWANACGELFWCRHDKRGEMVCGEQGTEQLDDADLISTARFMAGCGPDSIVNGRKEIDRAAWKVDACGKPLACEYLGGAWVCRPQEIR